MSKSQHSNTSCTVSKPLFWSLRSTGSGAGAGAATLSLVERGHLGRGVEPDRLLSSTIYNGFSRLPRAAVAGRHHGDEPSGVASGVASGIAYGTALDLQLHRG